MIHPHCTLHCSFGTTPGLKPRSMDRAEARSRVPRRPTSNIIDLCRRMLLILLCAGALPVQAATIWNSAPVTFTKSANSSATQAANQDRITANVWLTRGATQGLFNAKTETSYKSSSPADTEWAYGTTASYASLRYQTWVNWHGKDPESAIGKPAVVHLISDDIYIDITMMKWDSRTGGGFSYQRASAPGTTTTPPATQNYEGLWWNAPAGSESGWGINLTHQGDVIFATWFTYDLTGKAWWLGMTATPTGPDTFSGALFQAHGPAFDAVPFNPGAVVATQVGTGTLTFTDAQTGSFSYTVNGSSQTKAITRQVFGPLPTCTFGTQPNLALATNYQDLWWAAPAGSEAGWGINFTHQGDIIFATWFTYDHDGTPLWLGVTANKTGPSVFSGTLYRTTGPAFNAVPFNPASVVATAVGSATLTFTNGNTGTFAYSVNGVAQTKPITREILREPGTVCQ